MTFVGWGIFARGWVNLMVRDKTISLGTLRGAKAVPEPNQGRTQQQHSGGTARSWGAVGQDFSSCKM